MLYENQQMQNILLNLYIQIKGWIFFTSSPHCVTTRPVPGVSLDSSRQSCLAMVAEAALNAPLHSSAALLLRRGQWDGHRPPGSHQHSQNPGDTH